MESTQSSEQNSQSLAAGRSANITFSGKAGEFFGIWIVNLLLSIVTLGIYSAWATVRTRQYFYGHTKIEQQSFHYLASPIQILKGRIIAVIVFALFFIASSLSPVAAIILVVLFTLVSPLLIVLSLKFNMRMSRYRNVRFAFHGNYLGAFTYFILLPAFSVLSLYLALPWALKKIDQYICSNISFGGQKMQVNTEPGPYYVAALIAMAAIFGLIFALVIIAAITAGIIGMSDIGSSGNAEVWALLITGSIMVIYFLGFALSGAIYHVYVRNYLFERTTLPGIASFQSKMKVMPYLMLIITNLLAIIFSLGLAYPWAKVRKAAYLASVTSLTIYPQADYLVDEQQSESQAFAEEAVGLFDIDISIA